jgi:hypothetical protein
VDEISRREGRPKTWRETTGRGDAAELAVLLALTLDGKRVLRPVSSAARYDLLVDNEDGTFMRIQCKNGLARDGRIEFRVYSVSGHKTKTNPYEGQIDAFGVYCPADRTTYLIPVAALVGCSTTATLRVSRPRNGQRRGIRDASRFRIGIG